MNPGSIFTDRALPLIAKAADTCVAAMFKDVSDAKMTRNNTFKGDFMQYYADYFRKNSYPTLHITMPVFIGIGGADVDAPTALQTDFVRKTCEAGSIIEAHLYSGLGHSETVNRSFSESSAFAQAVMNGRSIANTCNSKIIVHP